MKINLLGLKLSRKASFASLIMILLVLMFLMAMLPFSTANGSTLEIKALRLTTIPRIDADWSIGEWDDAFEYAISNGSLTSYVRVKWGAGNVTGNFLYIIIDSPWDTTPADLNPNENYWVAFDTLNNGGNDPQSDDYLFNDGFSDWIGQSWEGTGSGWKAMLTPEPGYVSIQNNCNSTSPHNSTKHMICEFRIPLTHVGPIGSTIGFYMLAIDDSADPNHDYDPPGSPRYVEYPSGAGGNSSGWVPGPNPTPAPSAWGHLTLLQRPTASFIYSPDTPDVNETVTFDASASQDPDGSIVNYTWNFGDGNVSWVPTPLTIHTFSVGGSYNVNLTVTDNDGLNSSVMHTLSVGVPRAAFIFSPPSPDPSDTVTFDASTSMPRWNGTAYVPIVNYTWDFDDTNITTVNVTTVTHTFSAGGSYDVSLTVTDDTGLNASVVHTVNVGIPVANFTFWPFKPNAGDAVIFDATASQDPDGSIINYTWDFDDTNITTVNVTTVTHTFSAGGSYDVSLTVTDDYGLKGSIVDIVTIYAPREAHFSFSPSTPNEGDAVTFDASLSIDPGGTIANYTWDFDDSNIITVNAPTDTIIHIFSTSGSYNVNLTITDNDGLKSWYNNTINVGIPPFQATAPYSPIIPTINGIGDSGEWNDANEYIINGTGGEGYILVKWGSGNVTGEFLYILVDSPWDTTLSKYSSKENTWTAFDTEHDKSTVGPQTDDYLFNSDYSSWNKISWQGNGTLWKGAHGAATNFLAAQSNSSGHRIDEIRIPLAYVGTVGQTSGFYVIVADDFTDPDGWGLNLPPTAWVEWPARAGGDSRGWPTPPDYIDPCPTLDKWGYLFLEPQTFELSNVTLDISSSSITLGESVTITGTVFNSTEGIAWAEVTIQYRLTGTTVWTNITTVTTSSLGSYTHDWTPKEAGTYEIRAIWPGDAYNYGAESKTKTLKVTSEAIPILVIAAILAVVVVVIAIAVYLLKVRKPKR